MGNTLANTGVVCQNDGFCTYDPNNGAAAPGILATFNGQLPGGTWRMCVGDSAAGDVGAVDSVTLNMSL